MPIREVAVDLQTSADAAQLLTAADRQAMVGRVLEEAELLPDWAPGQLHRLIYHRGGRRVLVLLTYSPDGYRASIDLLT